MRKAHTRPTVFGITICAAVLALAFPATAANLLSNASFEIDGSGWDPHDSRILLVHRGDLGSTLAGGTGPGTLEIQFVYWSGSFNGGHQDVEVEGGKSYDVATSVLMPSEDNPANLAGLYVEWYAADSTRIDGISRVQFRPTPDAWVRIEDQLIAPAEATGARFWLVVGTPSLEDEESPGVAIFDDAYFGEVAGEVVEEFFVPAAAAATGQGGTYWSTAGWFSNATTVSVELAGSLLRQGQANSASVSSPQMLATIPPAGFARIDDLVSELGGSQLTGGLYLRATATGVQPGTKLVDVTTHTFTPNPNGGGTYGQGIPARKAGGGGTVRIPGVFQNTALRTNVGALNTSTETIMLEVRIDDASGSQAAITTWTLQPFEQRQVGLPTLGISSIDGGTVTIRMTAGDGTFLGYTSSVDQVSGDAIYNAAR